MNFFKPQHPDFPVDTSYKTALAALLANGEVISHAKVLNPEYSGYLQSCAEMANRSLLAALSMLNRLSVANMDAANSCRINPNEVSEVLRDLTAIVSETAPILMEMAVDLALDCEKEMARENEPSQEGGVQS